MVLVPYVQVLAPYIQVLVYILIGCITGLSMGTTGVGAGLIAIPLLVYSGLGVKEAVATTMVMQLLPQSLPGVLHYRPHIRWVPSLLVIVGSVLGIWAGSVLVTKNHLTEKTMYRLLTLFLLFGALYFFRNHW